MSILSGPEILRRRELGQIIITPFDAKHVGPNSVDLHLGDELLAYDMRDSYMLNGQFVIDAARPPPTFKVQKTGGGWLLWPGWLYLGHTKEYTETYNLVPYIDGRSSFGRLGVFAHVTAGRGDNGFKGNWTVELTAVHPTIIYPGGRYFQVTYHTLEGDPKLYNGRYQGDTGPTASRINREEVDAVGRR